MSTDLQSDASASASEPTVESLIEPNRRREMSTGAKVSVAIGAVALGSLAVGALAMGAAALGTLAIGRLALKRLTKRRVRRRQPEFDDVFVQRLQVEELVVTNRLTLPDDRSHDA